jgi:hypothetical protein
MGSTGREIGTMHTHFRGTAIFSSTRCEVCGALLVDEKGAGGRIWSRCPKEGTGVTIDATTS